MKLQESKGKYSIFIPKAIVQAFGWEKGDEIMFGSGSAKGRIELKKK